MINEDTDLLTNRSLELYIQDLFHLELREERGALIGSMDFVVCSGLTSSEIYFLAALHGELSAFSNNSRNGRLYLGEIYIRHKTLPISRTLCSATAIS